MRSHFLTCTAVYIISLCRVLYQIMTGVGTYVNGVVLVVIQYFYHSVPRWTTYVDIAFTYVSGGPYIYMRTSI